MGSCLMHLGHELQELREGGRKGGREGGEGELSLAHMGGVRDGGREGGRKRRTPTCCLNSLETETEASMEEDEAEEGVLIPPSRPPLFVGVLKAAEEDAAPAPVGGASANRLRTRGEVEERNCVSW
jgi:hypothetical protein